MEKLDSRNFTVHLRAHSHWRKWNRWKKKNTSFAHSLRVNAPLCQKGEFSKEDSWRHEKCKQIYLSQISFGKGWGATQWLTSQQYKLLKQLHAVLAYKNNSNLENKNVCQHCVTFWICDLDHMTYGVEPVSWRGPGSPFHFLYLFLQVINQTDYTLHQTDLKSAYIILNFSFNNNTRIWAL